MVWTLKHVPAVCDDSKFCCTLFGMLCQQGDALCKDCFFITFETEVHHTIIYNNLFTKGQVVAIGASGGKGNTATDIRTPFVRFTFP